MSSVRVAAAALCLVLALPPWLHGRADVVDRERLRPPTFDVAIEDPQLSPDGRSIAFVQVALDAAGVRVPQIHRLDIESGERRRLSSSLAAAWSPRWSPDGRRLAFLARGPGEMPAQVHVLGFDGGAPQPITSPPAAPTDLVWAPDSRLIFFLAPEAPASAPPDAGRRHLSVVDLDGVTTRITFGAFAILDYALSPSGSTIAMTRAPSTRAADRGTADVWVMDANGGNARRLTAAAGPVRRAQVSPDGATVLYHERSREPPAPRDGNSASVDERSRLFVVPRAGGPARALGLETSWMVHDARWLDDRRIVMLAAPRPAGRQRPPAAPGARLVEVDVRTGAATPMTPPDQIVGDWTVDGRSHAIVFAAAAAPSGAPGLFLVRPGQAPRPVMPGR